MKNGGYKLKFQKLRKIVQIVFDQKKFFKEYHFGKPQFFFSSL